MEYAYFGLNVNGCIRWAIKNLQCANMGRGKGQVNRAFIAGECSERAVVEVICFIDSFLSILFFQMIIIVRITYHLLMLLHAYLILFP